MKYSEFKAEVEKMGYTYNEGSDGIFVQNSVGTIAVVGRYNTHAISTTWGAFGLLTEFEKGQFFNLCHKLAKTPLAEREEEKRYRLRISAPLVKNDGYVYLTYIPVSAWYQLGLLNGMMIYSKLSSQNQKSQKWISRGLKRNL